MFENISLIGEITTIEPFNVSIPGRNGLPTDSKGNPYIPASTIRGSLRHSIHEGLVALKAEEDEFFNVDQHYMIASGIDTARVVVDDESVGATLAVRQDNPVLSVFGRWKLPGKLAVGNALATKEDVVMMGRGVRGHLFNRTPSMSRFVKEDEIGYLMDILAADKDTSEATKDLNAKEASLERENKTATRERRKEIAEELKQIKEAKREIKDSRTGASESIQRPLDGFEVIDANVALPHRMSLATPTDEEMKTLLFALIAFSKRNVIGGHRNLGCGTIHAKWNIVKKTLRDAPVTLGSVTIDDNGFTLDYADSSFTEANIIEFAKQLSVSEGIKNFG